MSHVRLVYHFVPKFRCIKRWNKAPSARPSVHRPSICPSTDTFKSQKASKCVSSSFPPAPEVNAHAAPSPTRPSMRVGKHSRNADAVFSLRRPKYTGVYCSKRTQNAVRSTFPRLPCPQDMQYASCTGFPQKRQKYRGGSCHCCEKCFPRHSHLDALQVWLSDSHSLHALGHKRCNRNGVHAVIQCVVRSLLRDLQRLELTVVAVRRAQI